MEKKLVIEGGQKILFKDYDSPDPVPESVFNEIRNIIGSNKLWRYQHKCSDESHVSLLEKEFAEYLGVKYALGVSSCSAAMYIGLLCAGVKNGDKVLTSGFTFIAVPSTIHHVGATPILVECNDNYCIDPIDLKQKILKNKDAKVLLLSHMRGHISQMDKIVNLCNENNIVLIEDCAHSLGSKWDSKHTGRFGKIGCFSFQSFKMINAGEGGMFVTDDDDIFAQAMLYSGSFEKNWDKHLIKSPKVPEFQKRIPIYNFRMTEIIAAIARPQIATISEKIKRYNENYDLIKCILERSPYINLPDKIDTVERAPDSVQFRLKNFSAEKINALIEILKLEGIEIGYFGNSNNVRNYKNWEFLELKQELPQTSIYLSTTCEIRLPIFITSNEVEVIGEIIVLAVDYVFRANTEPMQGTNSVQKRIEMCNLLNDQETIKIYDGIYTRSQMEIKIS